MGKHFFRLVELAIASGALVIPSTGLAEGRQAPAHAATLIVKSARLDKDGLTIQFSGPVKAPVGVDANKFRLTFAYYSKTKPGYYSYYRNYYGAQRTVTRYENVGEQALGGRIEQIAPAKIRISPGRGLSVSALCKEVASAQPAVQKAGLYLHYSGGNGGGVEGTDGARLASIAPYWLAKEDGRRTGTFEGRPIPVDVTCR
jgi:hypothetical protein